MNQRSNWKLSSSNLRICLKLFEKWGFSCTTCVGQFQWLYSRDTFYLYNKRSRIILASSKFVDGKLFIRYRTRSRYRHVIQKWGESARSYNYTTVAIASDHLGRWERRMRYLQQRSSLNRIQALGRYAEDVLHINPDVMSDGLSRRLNGSRAISSTRSGIITDTVQGFGPPQSAIVSSFDAYNDALRRIVTEPPNSGWNISYTEEEDEDETFNL